MQKSAHQLKINLETSNRRHLLPFDQISFNEQMGRQRNRSVIQRFLPSLINVQQTHQATQKQRMMILSKINDKSYEQLSFKKSIIDIFHNQIDLRINLFKPDDHFILIWNFLMISAITFNFVQIPLSLFLTDSVYESQHNTSPLFSINIISFVLLFLDTFAIRFNLAFFRHGKLIVARSQIFIQYIRLNFWLDFTALLSYFIYFVSSSPALVYLKLLFYLKLAALHRIDRQIQYTLNIHLIRFCLYKLFRVILFLWIVTTWVSSIYFAIDYFYYREKGYYYNTGQLWLTNSNCVQNINLMEVYPYWYIWYEYAAYWSLQTSAGIGYGNMTPRNPPEVLFGNIVILLNTIFFAIFINTIWEIIQQVQSDSSNFSDNWTNFKEYIRNYKIPRYIHKKMANYLQELWTNQGAAQREQQLVNMLSEELKSQFFIHIRQKFFHNVPLFQQLQTSCREWNQFVKQFVFVLQREKIGSGEIIYSFGDKDSSIYFLVQGKIGLDVRQMLIGNEVHINQHFGVYQFLTQSIRLNSATSLTFCQYWKVSSDIFKRCIRKYNNLYYKYCQIWQKISLSDKVSKMQVIRSPFYEVPYSKFLEKDLPQGGFFAKIIDKFIINQQKISYQKKQQC